MTAPDGVTADIVVTADGVALVDLTEPGTAQPAPRSGSLRRNTRGHFLRLHARLAGEGHPAPLDAVRAEALEHLRSAARLPAVGVFQFAHIAAGVDDALTELEDTAAPVAVEVNRCICSGDRTGEDIDERPDCPAHGGRFITPPVRSGW